MSRRTTKQRHTAIRRNLDVARIEKDHLKCRLLSSFGSAENSFLANLVAHLLRGAGDEQG